MPSPRCPNHHAHPFTHPPEHEHLALALEEGQHLTDVLLKPQVHHAICLIQAQVAADVKVHAPLAAGASSGAAGVGVGAQR